MTTPIATLEWEGFNLYRVSGTRREFVGTILRDAFSDNYTIFLRGLRIETSYPSLTSARAALESAA